MLNPRSHAWRSLLAMAAVVGAVHAAAHVAGREVYLTQLTMAAYYAIVVMGLCLVMGYAGQVSLGHGAFFAIGGYTSALLTTDPRLSSLQGGNAAEWLQRLGILCLRPELYGSGKVLAFTPSAAFLAGIALAGAVALLIGYPSLRLKGHYLAMATLGFGLIVYKLVQGSALTNGADGLAGVPAWSWGGGVAVSGRAACRVENYYIAWGLALGVLALLQNLVHSRVGRALRSIHDSELAANAMGIDTAGYKLRVFALSAVLAAAAGCFMTHYTGGIGPGEAGAMKSIRYVALVAVGGMANLWGALVLSTVINFLSLRGVFGSLDEAVFGVLLIVIVTWAPAGPLRPAGDWLRSVFRRRRRMESVDHAAA